MCMEHAAQVCVRVNMNVCFVRSKQRLIRLLFLSLFLLFTTKTLLTHPQAPKDFHLIACGLEELSARMGYGSCILTGHAAHSVLPHSLPSNGTTIGAGGGRQGSNTAAAARPSRSPAVCCVSGAGLPLYLHTQILVRGILVISCVLRVCVSVCSVWCVRVEC